MIFEKLVLKDYKPYSKMVAEAYEARPAMESQYVSSWKSLISHTEKMFKQIQSKVNIEFVDTDPYKSFEEMKADIEKTGTMKVWTGASDHPVWSPEQNWKFRAVHDYMVHIAGGHKFTLRGEVGAYNRHAKTVPPDALTALFTEVVGQVCYYETLGKFASQKICKLHGFDYIKVGEVDNEKYKENFSVKENLDSVMNLIDESYSLYEAKKISGLDYRDYLALLLFVDAFVDVVQKEELTIAEKVVQPGIPVLDSVWEYFDQNDLDIWTFVDRRPAYTLVRNLNNFWKDSNLTAEDLAKFDENAFVNLALQAIGRDVSIADDKKVKAFLEDMGAVVPTREDLGIELDTKRYEAADKAIELLKSNVTEDRKEKVSAVPYVRHALDSLLQARKHFDPKRIHTLDRVIYDLESFL